LFEESWQIHYYVKQNGRSPYHEWFDALGDSRIQEIINVRLGRIRLGNFGHCAPVGLGIFEMKIYWGQGYRIYFARTGRKVILLLCGGNKSTQQKDIQNAHRYWRNYKERTQ